MISYCITAIFTITSVNGLALLPVIEPDIIVSETVTACCPTIEIEGNNKPILAIVNGERQYVPTKYGGVYKHNGTLNSRDYWIQENGDFAMWYQEASSDPYWVIGKLDGSNDDIQTLSGKAPSFCPNDENNVWYMNMLDSEEDTPSQYQNFFKWVSINDQISMKCKGAFPNCNLEKGECCVESWTGDGVCDTMNNFATCNNYDGGDCIPPNVRKLQNCPFNPKLIGDGTCQAQFNTPDCNFDGGDCPECTTISGSDQENLLNFVPDSKCEFPFIFRGKTYTTCLPIKKQKGKYFCSVEVDDGGKHKKNRGGICGPSCPLPHKDKPWQ